MWDAIVAGAGPAGAVAAHVLARGGRKVLLVDAVDPAAPKIGEALPGAALRLLRALCLPIPDRDGPHAPIGGNFSSWGSDDLVATDFIRDPAGPGWRLDRLRFDADLRAAAINAGAVDRSGLIANAERRGSHWRVELKDGTFETARWIIDATGRRATVARRLGAKRLRDTQLIALYAMSGSSGFQLNRTIIEAVPHGWWYAAQLPSGAVLAGFHTSHQHAMSLLADPCGWSRALAQTQHLSAALPDVRFENFPRPLDASGASLNRYGGEGWIACGDAALSFDPISGQGIFSALYSGMTAAHAVEDALNGSDEKLDEYSRRLEQVRRIYIARSRAVYRSELRWTDEPFWSTLGAERLDVSKVSVTQSVLQC
jgi:flavin-dependent dehydrogenase